MRLWDRLTGRKAEEGDTDVWERDEVPPEDGTDEGGEGNDEQPQDPLAELDDETREIAEAYAAKQLAAERAKAREALRSRGLDVGDDYQPVIADPGKVQGWLGVPTQAQTPPAAEPPPAAEEELGTPPDPSYDPEGFSAWLRKRDDRMLKDVNTRLEQIAQRQAQTEAQTVPASAVAQALTAYNPALAAIVEHPDFEAAYRQQLLQVDRQYWSDPRSLAAIAGMVAPYLDPAKQPQPRQRDDRGRYVESPGDRAAAMRAGRVQLTPSQEASGGQPSRRYEDGERAVVERYGAAFGIHSMEEWDALSDPEGNATRRLKAKQAARNGGRR